MLAFVLAFALKGEVCRVKGVRTLSVLLILCRQTAQLISNGKIRY